MMESKEILEGNKLIAEFIGWRELSHTKSKNWMLSEVVDGISYAKKERSLERMEFHASWEWLMPVVEKIEGNVDYEVAIANGVCTISAPDKSLRDCFTDVIACVHFPDAKSKIEAVYKAVIQFIQWLNHKPTNNK